MIVESLERQYCRFGKPKRSRSGDQFKPFRIHHCIVSFNGFPFQGHVLSYPLLLSHPIKFVSNVIILLRSVRAHVAGGKILTQ